MIKKHYFISLLFILFMSTSALAAKRVVNTKKVIETIFHLYDQGRYDDALSGLEKIQANIAEHIKNRTDVQGLIYYWQGLCYSRINEFELASEKFKKSIDLKFAAKNIYYEYAQSLYALDKLKEARIAFKQSIRNKFKMAISLYYIAYISQQLHDYKKAVAFYNAIEKLSDAQKAEVVQAARMQVADIYLKQVEKMPNTFRSVKKYVIPQYEKALQWNKEGRLADEIREKIKTVQRRYDLLLFKMRNGVPTAFPRYFVKLNALYGSNSNVNNLDATSLASLDKKDYASNYYNAGLYSRYTFYPNSSYSISPELILNYTKYQSDSANIKVNNNLTYRGGIQLNFEHIYKQRPATFYLNIAQSVKEDDADANDQLAKANDTSTVTFSESLQFWAGNPTTLRYRYTSSKAVEETNSYTTQTVIWQQLVNSGSHMLFFYNSFDMTKYAQNTTSNNNALTLRVDWILPRTWGISPTFFVSDKMTNYIENADRGVTSLISYGVNITRQMSKKWYVTVDYILDSQSAKQDSDVYKATKIDFNLNYYY